jgi:hypothetical protein
MANSSNKIMTGARALLQIGKTGTDPKFQTVGIFSDVSYGITYGTAPAYVLGRYEAVEISYTDQGTVGIDATGWRVVGNGAHVAAQLPYLQQLLNAPYIQIQLVDRQTGVVICHVKDVRAVSYSTGQSARGQSTVRVSFIGRVISDEGNDATTVNGPAEEGGFIDDAGAADGLNNSNPLDPV